MTWLPEFEHYWIPSQTIADDVLGLARRIPDDTLLDELSVTTRLFGLEAPLDDDKQLVIAAEKLLRGDVELPGFPRRHITIPFSSRDVSEGSPVWQLSTAALFLPDVLLRAFKATHREEFLLGARDMIMGWASYERHAWVSGGFLWNDHAVAARVVVLAHFWRHYRAHPAYDVAVAQSVLQFTSRSGYLLARQAHFTAATNHGVMQNLALWHLALAVPALPETASYRKVATDRLQEQMGFYINNEGVVLEHSAGYHRMGLELLGIALRYRTLLDIPTPSDWLDKYQKALTFYARLRRPNGSLPMFGDTASGSDTTGPLVVEPRPDGSVDRVGHRRAWRPDTPSALYPNAGYAIWWHGLPSWPDERRLAQTVTVWSHFRGHGHKHADEMSILLWAGGYSWWGNVGYWPESLRGRKEAESWRGSNAPHLAHEPMASPRQTRLVSYGSSDDAALIHLERQGPDRYVARRQVVHIGPNIWIVVDRTSGDPGHQTVTQWTTSHEVVLTQTQPGDGYTLRVPTKPLAVAVFLLTSPPTTIRHLRESFAPFGGWQMTAHGVQPADSLVIEQPANGSWAIALWCLLDDSRPEFRCPTKPYVQGFRDDENWSIDASAGGRSLMIRRAGSILSVERQEGDPRVRELMLSKPEANSAQVADVRGAFERVERKYPRFRELLSYRFRVTYAVLLVAVLQEGFFIVHAVLGWTRRRWWQALCVAGWGAVGVWVVGFYFRY